MATFEEQQKRLRGTIPLGTPAAKELQAQGFTDVGSLINKESVLNGQDPFNLEDQSPDQLSQILKTIQDQISQGNQNQTSALDILRQSRETAGIPGLTEKLAGIQSLIGQRETGFEQASNILSEQLAPQPFITGQQAALERRKQTELAGLQRQELALESQLGRAETGARFEAGLVADELKELRGRPKELIDLVSKVFGLQADVAGERRAEAQEKRAVEKALRDAKAENKPKFEQVGDTLLRLDPDGTVTPVFTSPKKGKEDKELDILDIGRYNEQFPGAGVVPGDTKATADAKVAKLSQPRDFSLTEGRTIGTAMKEEGLSFDKAIAEVDADPLIQNKEDIKRMIEEVYGKKPKFSAKPPPEEEPTFEPSVRSGSFTLFPSTFSF